MDDLKREKIKQFLRDKIMADAVYQVILDTFLEQRDGDVYTKAAQRMAIDFHIESWLNLSKINTQASIEQKTPSQKAL